MRYKYDVADSSGRRPRDLAPAARAIGPDLCDEPAVFLTFGLRDYGTGRWEGGDEGCDHVDPKANKVFGNPEFNENRPSREQTKTVGYRDVCGKCGATRIDSQIGLEPTPDEYVQALVEVFREVRRVLRDDGTLWLNLGDSYNAYNGNRGPSESLSASADAARNEPPRGLTSRGTKPKDLLGIPWLVAFALRADGWYLRSDIVWAKPNPMPESVTDRPTKAHEYLFLLSKRPTYYFDADAIREEGQDWSKGGPGTGIEPTHHYGADNGGNEGLSALAGRYKDGTQAAGRNKRSVWTVATQPFPGAHFAVFPPRLIEPCVLAGTSERACGVCGAPYERQTKKKATGRIRERSTGGLGTEIRRETHGLDAVGGTFQEGVVYETTGWKRPCRCDAMEATLDGSCVVLDPFAGAGTTGLVATRHGRSFIGIELNPEYAEMARERIRDDAPLMNYLTEAA